MAVVITVADSLYPTAEAPQTEMCRETFLLELRGAGLKDVVP